ncbi:hypothetical protein MBLNU230_g1978t1 [Neophaeotheca triangularis]
MEFDQPANKRQRLDHYEGACDNNEPVDAFVSPAASWGFDGFAQDPSYLASQAELRSLMFDTARSVPPHRPLTPSDKRQDEQPNLVKVLAHGNRVKYLSNYLSRVAPWLDMFDNNRTFGTKLPVAANQSPPLMYSILAIGARQLERKDKIKYSFNSLELYQEAIRLLTPLLQARDTNVIATCVILCCLEMFTASAQDWRRHLEGCAAIFESFGVNGFSGGVLQAVFWCYARMDVCGALISDGAESTLIKPSQWLLPGISENDVETFFSNHQSPDMYANFAVYLCAKTCELISDRNKFLELGEENGCNTRAFLDRWIILWDQLSRWSIYRPVDLLPVETAHSTPFPHILFCHWAAISSNQLYHTSCVLLLGCKPKDQRLVPSAESSTLWHARRICGISLANLHEGCLNNAIQALWIAGRLFTHTSEHKIVIDTIRRIEKTTGWTAGWRMRDLERHWGYKSH